MKVLINYANNVFRDSQKLNSKTGKELGLFDKVISYTPKDIESDFFNSNVKILSQRRGNGYWLWKPYLIKKTLENMAYGDFLFYCDSGSYFIGPINQIIDIALETGQEIIPFELTNIEKNWTKRDAFILLDCDDPKYSESKQRMAGFSLWEKTRFTMEFIDEYLNYSQDERIITDLENQCGFLNYPGFVEHRHDQSIFSLLTKRCNLNAYRDPSQWGNGLKHLYTNSKYEQLIELTRKQNVPFLRKIFGNK